MVMGSTRDQAPNGETLVYSTPMTTPFRCSEPIC